MADPDDADDLGRWLRLMNKGHGYAGVFNYGSGKLDKSIVEMSTAQEWCRSIAAEFGVPVGEPEHNPNDPPDSFVNVEEQRLAVENVQLVEKQHKERALKGETPWHGQLYVDMQWSKERFESRLNDEVQKKGQKYERQALRIDILLIHTAEPWLSSGQAKEWFGEIEIKRHPSITNVFLLFEYEPGREAQQWPVFRVYGDLFHGPNR